MKTNNLSNIRFVEVSSKIGLLRIEGTPDTVLRLLLPGDFAGARSDCPSLAKGETYPALEEAKRWLDRYFMGEPVTWHGQKTPAFEGFTAKVYEALLQVPFGATVSYGELARMAGRPGAARAVGRAMATNPLALMIPCHRVIGSDGSLHGYGGGLPMKRALLEHEGVKSR